MRLFPVDIWGTVADWFEAVGTGGAAITAASYYILDGRKTKSAQAKLIAANSRVFEDSEMGVTVRNDSDRAITGFYLYYCERGLARALLLKDRFIVSRMVYYKPTKQIGKMNERTSTPINSIKSKAELLGYDGREGLIRAWGDKHRLLPGNEFYLPVLKTHPYRISTDYWLGFVDANGVAWEREVSPAVSVGNGRLRKAPGGAVVTAFRQHRVRRRKRIIGSISHYSSVIRWLMKHRGERTSTEEALAKRHEEAAQQLIAKYEDKGSDARGETAAER